MRPPIDFSRLDGHDGIVLLFSGGKASLALLHLFREHLGRIIVANVDTATCGRSCAR